MLESAHFDDLETRLPQERDEALFAALPRQIAHARASTAHYGRLFAEIAPEEVRDRAGLAALPLTRKSDLIAAQRERPPFGGLNAQPITEMGRLFQSPGPIYDPEGRGDDYWRTARAMHAAGFRAGDVVLNCFSYHLSPGGFIMDAGARALGCPVIPAGPGNTDQQLRIIADLRPVAYAGTPSFLKILLDKGGEAGIDVACLRKAMVSGEALPPSLRADFRQRGIAVFQCYATADLGMVAYETPALEGMTVDERVLVEIVRPGTGDPVPEGEVGEVVVTTFCREYPLIRFATGDLSAALPGESPCGRTNMRIKGWMGRADQTTKVRGMFVHPAQIADVLRRHPEIGRARLVVGRAADNDVMTLRCETEATGDGLAEAVRSSLHALCKLRGEVELLAPGTLPNDGKVIDDVRSYE